jgi:hypothetical protein
MRVINFILISVFMVFGGCTQVKEKSEAGKVWPVEKARMWQEENGWVNGSNFLPSTAVNALDFWQKETFDPATIDRELGYAEDLGFNIMRVWLNSLVWKSDPEGLKDRINQYLTISSGHGIKTMFVFFCDCWNPDSKPGPQPEPKPGVHNSQWVQDPSCDLRTDTASLYPWLEEYVKDIITAYKDDPRVIVWDLYNEPGASRHGNESLPLVKNVFRWARDINPTQPLTVGIYNLRFHDLNAFSINNSDIITYHNYNDLPLHSAELNLLKLYNRPMICTEWMARHFNSKFQNVLPMLKKENVGSINWGLVAGETNTLYKWGEPMPDGKEPELWFHDILRKDGTPFDQAEVDSIKAVNSSK